MGAALPRMKKDAEEGPEDPDAGSGEEVPR
jgi:hypothetical protein